MKRAETACPERCLSRDQPTWTTPVVAFKQEATATPVSPAADEDIHTRVFLT